MRYALMLWVWCLALLSCSGSVSAVESGLIGTWELNVPNAQGVARWVWEIHADGTYAFHAEGPGGVPAHSGSVGAKNGRYTLQSTTLAWSDSGTYQLIHDNTLQATGKLGTGSWQRVPQSDRPTQGHSTIARSAASDNARSGAVAGIYNCSGIPGLRRFELRVDGSYVSTGSIMDHAISGAGRYAVSANQITLNGADAVEGLPKPETVEMTFDRQHNGDLKWILATCKRQ